MKDYEFPTDKPEYPLGGPIFTTPTNRLPISCLSRHQSNPQLDRVIGLPQGYDFRVVHENNPKNDHIEVFPSFE